MGNNELVANLAAIATRLGVSVVALRCSLGTGKAGGAGPESARGPRPAV